MSEGDRNKMAETTNHHLVLKTSDGVTLKLPKLINKNRKNKDKENGNIDLILIEI